MNTFQRSAWALQALDNPNLSRAGRARLMKHSNKMLAMSRRSSAQRWQRAWRPKGKNKFETLRLRKRANRFKKQRISRSRFFDPGSDHFINHYNPLGVYRKEKPKGGSASKWRKYYQKRPRYY